MTCEEEKCRDWVVLSDELLDRKQECIDNLDMHPMVIRELEDVLREIELILIDYYW